LLIREEWCDEEIHKKNNLPEGDVGQTKDGSVSYRVFLFTGVADESNDIPWNYSEQCLMSCLIGHNFLI
jgi:hypothetical protein